MQDTLAATPFVALPFIGGDLDERERLAHLTEAAPLDGYLVRSVSSRIPRPDGAGPVWKVIAPQVETVWNSAAPFSLNDGALWAGRGLNSQATAGVWAAWGPVSLVLAPQLVYQQNEDFGRFIEYEFDVTARPPWHSGLHSLDVPLRFGEDATTAFDLGQSTLSVAAGPVTAGVSTENNWWGPGVRNALVLSNHAAGFPHLFLRTGEPLRTPLGSLEGKLLGGWLTESEYFDELPDNDVRSISAFALTLRPSVEPNLTLGVARSVQAGIDGERDFPGSAADALVRWSGADSTDFAAGKGYDRILSLFGRWVFPADGMEVWGEWARQGSSAQYQFRGRETSDGYTLGAQGARGVGAGGTVRVQAELTYLEQEARQDPFPTLYTSGAVVQGYTQRGQVIGAAIGPAGSSQWLAADYLSPRWRLGAFVSRIRWDNDSFYRTFRAFTGWSFLAHDVSLFGGIRGSYHLPGIRVDAELTTGTRYNYLFQNRGLSWESAGDAVDVRNHSLRLVFTPFAPRGQASTPLERPTAPVPPPPAPVQPADSIPIAAPGPATGPGS